MLRQGQRPRSGVPGVVLTEGVGDDELIKAVALFYDPRVPWSGPGRPPDWLWDGESILYVEASGLVRDVSGREIEDAKGPLAVLERLRLELQSYPLRAAQRAGRRALRLRDFSGARDVLARACRTGCPPGDETAYVQDLVACAPGGNREALERWNAGETGRRRAERFYDRQRENGDPAGILASDPQVRAALWELVASRREGPSLLRSLRVELDCSPPCDPGEEERGGPDQRLVLRLAGGPLGASPWEVVDTDGLVPPAGPFGAPSPQASKDRLLAAIGRRIVAVVGRTALELDLSTRTARPIGPADALFSDGEPTVYLASLRDDGYSWTVSAWDASGPVRLLGSYGFADAAPALDAVWRLRRDGEGVAYEDPLTGRRIPLRRL